MWVWQGMNSNVKEKVKAIQFAREFDADRAGNQKPKVFIENADDSEFLGIFEGKLPTQDHARIDLKAERFNEGSMGTSPTTSGSQSVASAPTSTPSKPPTQNADGLLIQKGEGRLQCPKCGIVDRRMFREELDKTHIINPYPVMYGKKWICGACGANWRKED